MPHGKPFAPLSFVPARKSRFREGHSRGAMRIYQRQEWRALQKKLKQERPKCQAGCGNVASQIHHRRALSEGGAAFDIDNLVFLCAPCHREAHSPTQLR